MILNCTVPEFMFTRAWDYKNSELEENIKTKMMRVYDEFYHWENKPNKDECYES